MTKLRKLTALLLAGALTLLLLTACSGGGGSSDPEAQAEAKVMRAINNGRAVALTAAPWLWPMTMGCVLLQTPVWMT